MSQITLIEGKNINEEKWDSCVNRFEFPLIYGNVWYLDLVCEEWDALVYGDYDAILPLPFKSKGGLNYVYRPYGVQQLGVFGDISKTEELLSAIPAKYVWVDIFLNAGNELGKHISKSTPQTNLILDLSRSYESVYEGYSKQTKRNLKKAQKTSFGSFGYESPEQLISLFKLNKGKDLDNLQEKQYQKMTQIMHTLMHKNLGYINSLYIEPNHLCAAAFFMEWKGRVTLLFSVTDDSGKETQAMTKLLDELFIFRSNKPVLFDFEGSNIESLARFYKGFGAEVETYSNYTRNRLPIPQSIIRRLF
jgi:hypothetical protein